MPPINNPFYSTPAPGGETIDGGGGGGISIIGPPGSSPGNSGGGGSTTVQNTPNGLLVSGEEGVASAPYGSILTFTGFALSASMVGGTVTVVDPYVDAPEGVLIHNDGSNKIYNAATLNVPSPPPYGILANTGQTQLSGSFQFQITNVINETTCKAILTNTSTGFVFYTFDTTPIDPNLTAVAYSFTSFGPTGQSPAPTTNFTSSFVIPQQTVYTQQSQSFAQIVISDLDPATGDVYAIRTSYKPGGAYGNFIDLGLTVLEQQEQLTTGSLPNSVNPIFGAADPSTGLFVNLPDITDNWDALGIGGQSVVVTYEPANIMGGAKLTPGGAFSPGDAISFNLKADSGHMPELQNRTKYILEFGHYSTAVFPGPSDITETMRLDVYISGSQITRDSDFEPTDLLGSDFQSNGIYGTFIGSVSNNVNAPLTVAANRPYQNTTFEFEANETKSATVYFVVRGGSWTIADVSLRTNVETGFTSNYARMDIRIPSQHLNTPLTFRFEYLDYQGSPAALTSFIYGAVFSGENLYIQGNSNLITGSTYIGSGIGEGIEQSGQNSGYIRSVGYNGFTSASAGSGSGWMMFSGSVLPSVTDDYSDGGVGLELVQDSGSYFRFRTAGPNAGLEVVTDKFFLGNTNNQFISGSNGNIEISSSNFHLSNQGLVTATNFAETLIKVDQANSASYFRDDPDESGGVMLIFDGTGGQKSGYTGSVTLNMELKTAPYNNSSAAVGPITNVLIPNSNVGRSCEVNVFISSSITNVTFDNDSVFGSIAAAYSNDSPI
jgi:hypothetical protein